MFQKCREIKKKQKNLKNLENFIKKTRVKSKKF